jgi:hypothetical protein
MVTVFHSGMGQPSTMHPLLSGRVEDMPSLHERWLVQRILTDSGQLRSRLRNKPDWQTMIVCVYQISLSWLGKLET